MATPTMTLIAPTCSCCDRPATLIPRDDLAGALAALEEELSSLLRGRKVDLRTARDLSRHFREEVVRTAQVHYAR